MAGKSIYSEEIEDFIAKYASMGIGPSKIAQALGLNEKTVHTWFGRKESLRKKVASLILEEASKRIDRTSPEYWLERVLPEFRLAKEINVTGELTINHLLEVRKKINEVAGLDEDGD